MVKKLNVILENMKKHDSILFQSSGLPLKQSEKSTHSFNVNQIKCVEAKLTIVSRAGRGCTKK